MQLQQPYTNLSECRLCASADLETVLDLGEQALSGVFPSSPLEQITRAPLRLVRCPHCGLVQLSVSVSLSEMYGENYGYRSGLNPSMMKHLGSKVLRIESLVPLNEGDVVIDIGSNDATTLKFYKNQDLFLIGVDPTGFKFKDYYPNHIKLLTEFFPSTNLSNLLDNRKAKVITSFSMFYDLEDPVSFAKSIADTLDNDGIWVFEQSYAPAMIEANSYDTVCHEHLEYYNLKQLKLICDKAGLKIVDIEFNDVNGGSISIAASKQSSSREEYGDLTKLLRDEDEGGYNSKEIYNAFQANIDVEKNKFLDFLLQAKSDGKSVHALGASTKGNTILQYLNIDSSLISSIGEVNTDKYGCFTPGTSIPIISESELLNKKPDYVVVLPWHFADFFNSSAKFSDINLVYPLPLFHVKSLQQ